MTAPRYARAQPSLTAARPLVRCAVKDGLRRPRPARPVGVYAPPQIRRARKACTSGLGRGRPLATCVRDRARDARALPSTPGLRINEPRPHHVRVEACGNAGLYVRCNLHGQSPRVQFFASLPFSASLTASPSLSVPAGVHPGYAQGAFMATFSCLGDTEGAQGVQSCPLGTQSSTSLWVSIIYSSPIYHALDYMTCC